MTTMGGQTCSLPMMASMRISTTTSAMELSKRLALSAAWPSPPKDGSWRPCAFHLEIMTTMAGSISTSQIFSGPLTISGITRVRDFSLRLAIKRESRGPRTMCLASVEASSITITMVGRTFSSPMDMSIRRSNKLRLKFTTSRLETVEVTWPSGQRQLFRNVEADKFYLIEEGKDQLQEQQFVRKTVMK